MIIVVVRLIEMFVKCEPCGARHVVPMGVEPEMGGRFAFPNVLVEGAFDTEAQVYAIFTLAIELMANLEFFPCSVAAEFIR